MSDRLAELRRQRALLSEHLAWLDGEIAVATGQSGVPPVPPTLRPPATPPSEPSPSWEAPASRFLSQRPAATLSATTPVGSQPAPSDVDLIIQKYGSAPRSLKSDVRKGCFIYITAAIVLLVLGVTALYFIVSTR